jgi:hypothetical protein
MMIKTRIRNKRDTLNNWTAKNPILLSGEIAIADDEENIKLKIGDGVTPYNSLPFYVGNYNDLKDKPVGFTCTVKDNNTKNYHHILSSGQCTNGWTDRTITLLVTQNSNDAGLGILRCSLRTNNVKNNEVAEGEITWLIRTGFAESSFCFNLRNTPKDTYMDVFYKASSTYMGLTWYVLSEGAMATDEELWTKYNTDATSETNVYTESEMSALREYTSTLVFSEDKGVVDQANDAYWADEAYKCTKAIQDDDGNVITDTYTTKEYVENLYKKLNTNRVLGFYCIEDVTIITNGVSTVYPANSNIDIKFIEGETFEIVPTSNNSILSLTSFPGALGTYYPWLEGVKQFSNILFDMNSEDMYTKWNQGNQGAYKVQYAQYSNCIFWSDLAFVTDVAKRTNYTLYYSTQMPLCYSNIPDNTFKPFYLAFNACSDPNWGNPTYRDSFSKATWATQVFSYYGARTVGIFGHDNSAFNIVLPKDCRGLMYAATAIENAGTFDAVNVTNFGAKSGSWREAFGECSSLRNLYIKNLKVGINVSWSPLNYDSIYFIISKAANTNKITISVSPYTYNLLSQSDFELAASKNITIELLTTNYVEDRRLNAVTITGDGSKVLSDDGTYKILPVKTSQLENDSDFITSTQLNSKAPAYQYSTTDLTAGVSELATGTIYIVYE